MIHIGNDASYNSQLGYMHYRSNYADYHTCYLPGLLFNLERLFPCAPKAKHRPVCRMFTLEEDGYLNLKEKPSLKKVIVETTLLYLVPRSIHMDLLFKDEKP